MLKCAQRAVLSGVLYLVACGQGAQLDGSPAQLGTIQQPIESMNGPELVGTSLAQTLIIADSVAVTHVGSNLICPLGNCTSAEFDGQVDGLTVRLKIESVLPGLPVPHYQVNIVGPAAVGGRSLCKVPGQSAIVIPGAWTASAARLLDDPATFSFACEESAAEHCRIRFGYDPLSARYQACTRMIRGDYCGDGRSLAKPGARIDAKDASSDFTNEGNPNWLFEAAWGVDGSVCIQDEKIALAAGCFRAETSCGSRRFSDDLLLKNLYLPARCQSNAPRCGRCDSHAPAGDTMCPADGSAAATGVAADSQPPSRPANNLSTSAPATAPIMDKTMLPASLSASLASRPTSQEISLTAARSFLITVENSTGRVWNRTDLGLSHGIWSGGGGLVPPEQIDKASLDEDGNPVPGLAQFGSESSGFATGTEGFVEYESKPTLRLPLATMRIEWVNPYVGSNRFYVTVSAGYRGTYRDIKGNNASPTVTITP